MKTDSDKRAAAAGRRELDKVIPIKPKAAAPDFSKVCLTPAAWAARELPPVDPLLGELLSTTCRMLLAADTGVGKTMWAMAIAIALHLGTGFLH